MKKWIFLILLLPIFSGCGPAITIKSTYEATPSFEFKGEDFMAYVMIKPKVKEIWRVPWYYYHKESPPYRLNVFFTSLKYKKDLIKVRSIHVITSEDRSIQLLDYDDQPKGSLCEIPFGDSLEKKERLEFTVYVEFEISGQDQPYSFDMKFRSLKENKLGNALIMYLGQSV